MELFHKKKASIVTFLCVGCVCVSTVTGCYRANAPTKTGAAAVSELQNTKKNRMPTPISMNGAAAGRINLLPDMKGAVVLVQGETAYVGVFPEYHGTAKPGQADRTRHNWPTTWDTKKGLEKLSPDDFIRALDTPARRADTFDYRPKSRSGMVAPMTQQKITDIVHQVIPSIHVVRITSDVASTSMLHGYADFISRGGNMTPFMPTFQARMKQIWPSGKGISSDRPSASPNFGTLGRPADHRTSSRSK